MAQKTLIQLVDDLDGTPIADGEGKTVSFSIDGVSYEIDLSNDHVDELDAALATFVSAARKTTRSGAGRASTGRTASTKSNPEDLQKIREWAKSNGHAVSDRGRIAASVRDAYTAAH